MIDISQKQNRGDRLLESRVFRYDVNTCVLFYERAFKIQHMFEFPLNIY